MSAIISIIVSLFKSLPLVEKLLGIFMKTEDEKAASAVEEVRKEIDEFRRTGRPPR